GFGLLEFQLIARAFIPQLLDSLKFLALGQLLHDRGVDAILAGVELKDLQLVLLLGIVLGHQLLAGMNGIAFLHRDRLDLAEHLEAKLARLEIGGKSETLNGALRRCRCSRSERLGTQRDGCAQRCAACHECQRDHRAAKQSAMTWVAKRKQLRETKHENY